MLQRLSNRAVPLASKLNKTQLVEKRVVYTNKCNTAWRVFAGYGGDTSENLINSMLRVSGQRKTVFPWQNLEDD